ncbi:MAG: 23S rRNA (adenine(2503)-C(2))-methyltransferase RlmN [Ignavibacteriales bacterium]|nr:23S rRNA (adenine(2503)-C(2))-methyltransferase RlmN [Ignavibacteriales bacterium]
MVKRNLIGLTLRELEDFALSIGEKKYRGKQIFDWLYTKGVVSFAEMTSLSKDIRERLELLSEINRISLIETQNSHKDETTKYLFGLSDGKRIESVLIPPKKSFQNFGMKEDDEPERSTLCLSTQVGCALDCKFCATASMGYLRNLTVGEIVDQLYQVRKLSGKRITNLVYMGMGEPLLNYENVMKSVEIISTGMAIAARRITISTAGWIPGIRKMAEENSKVKLAVSLHSLDDALRTLLMPINKKYPINDLLHAIEYYYTKTKNRVTFEYILFDLLNDRDSDIEKIIKLTKRIPCKLNIIPFHSSMFSLKNEIGLILRSSSLKRREEFVEQVRQNNVAAFVRSSAGEDIDAACGQLAVHHEQQKKRHHVLQTNVQNVNVV